MKTPAAYQARIDRWERWLDENPDAKPSVRASVHDVLAALYAIIPEAESESTRLRALRSPADPPEFDEWLTNRSGTVHHCGGLLVPAMIDGVSAVHCSKCAQSATLVRKSGGSVPGQEGCETAPTSTDTRVPKSGHSEAVQGKVATCRRGHPRSKANVYIRSDGRWECKPCQALAKQHHRD